MNILCIGKLTYDIICPMEGLPLSGQKYMNAERIENGGGEVANAAYLLGKWGVKPVVAGVVGSDDFATKIKKELEGVQIDTSLIETSYEKPTILSFIVLNKQDATSTIVRTYKKDFAALRKQDLGMTPDIILADGHEYGATHLMLERNPKAISVLIAEENKPEILELCKFSKYVLCSKEFAEGITNMKCDFEKPATLVNIYQTLKNRFPNNEIVVTLKNKGALYSVDGEIKIMPGINAKVTDLTGAGDAFRGAFVYGISNNFPMDKIITYANIAAGLTIENMGTRTAFPSLNDVINYYNQKFPAQGNGETNQANVSQIAGQNIQTESAPSSTTSVQTPNVNVTSQQSVSVTPIATQTQPVQPQAAPQPVQAPAVGVSGSMSAQPSQNNSVSMQAIPDVMPEIPKN